MTYKIIATPSQAHRCHFPRTDNGVEWDAQTVIECCCGLRYVWRAKVATIGWRWKHLRWYHFEAHRLLAALTEGQAR